MKLGKRQELPRKLPLPREALGISGDRQDRPEKIPPAHFLDIQARIDAGPEAAPPAYFDSLWYFVELQPESLRNEERKQKIISFAVQKINEIRLQSNKKDEERGDFEWRAYLSAIAILRRLDPELVRRDPRFQVDEIVRKEIGRLFNRDIMDSSMRGDTDWIGLLSDSLQTLIALPELLPLVKQKVVDANYWGGPKILTKARGEISSYGSDSILVYPALMKLLSLLEGKAEDIRLIPSEEEAMHLPLGDSNGGSFLLRHLDRLYFKNIIKARSVTQSSDGTLVFHWDTARPHTEPLPERELL